MEFVAFHLQVSSLNLLMQIVTENHYIVVASQCGKLVLPLYLLDNYRSSVPTILHLHLLSSLKLLHPEDPLIFHYFM